jgi:hypothetical protein
MARSDFSRCSSSLERGDLGLEGLPLAAEVARELVDAIEQHLRALLGAGDRASLASSAFVTDSQRSANSVRARCAASATEVTCVISACSASKRRSMLFFEISASRTVRSADFSSSVFSRSWSRVELSSFSVTPRREASPCTFIRRALALAERLEPVAQRLLGLELGLEVAELLARRGEIALALVMRGAQEGEPVRLLAARRPERAGLVLEHLERLAGLGELALVTGEDEVVRLRLLAQRGVLVDEGVRTLGLAAHLALELARMALLLAQLAADRAERRLQLLRALAQLVVVPGQAAELVLELEVLALEAADLMRERAMPFPLAGEHRFGLEQLRLELRQLGREGRDRLEQLREVVLEARHVLEPLGHVADSGADELVLHADRAEREGGVGRAAILVLAVAVAMQMLRPRAADPRIALIPRLKMPFQQAP